jgi:UDP-GlcNAc:undecaprenyl-phosphate GlcNAc-1-phosphate transferase
MRPIANRYGIYDVPAGRKNHHMPVLVIGGIAMMLSFCLSLIFIYAVDYRINFLILSLAIICIVGFVDDIYHLCSRHLFIAQVFAGLVMIYLGGTTVNNLGNLFGLGSIQTGDLNIVFTLICLLGVVNAVNMSDGMDGLAGLLVLIATAWFAVLAYLSKMMMISEIALLLIAAILGFLAFNMRTPWRMKASIFMGNAGSMSLGLLITWFAIEISGKIESSITPITAVWVIALPLMDMCRVMVGRIRKGQSPFVGDHMHMHHMLSSVGYSVSQVVAIKGFVSFLFGAIGVTAWYFGVSEWIMFYSFIVVLAFYFYITGSGWCHICHLIEKRRNKLAI